VGIGKKNILDKHKGIVIEYLYRGLNMKLTKEIREYLAGLGRKGGKVGKKYLSSERAREMVRCREAKRKQKGCRQGAGKKPTKKPV